jgi:hypothetical protein
MARGPHCGLTFPPTLRVGGGPKKKKKKTSRFVCFFVHKKLSDKNNRIDPKLSRYVSLILCLNGFRTLTKDLEVRFNEIYIKVVVNSSLSKHS